MPRPGDTTIVVDSTRADRPVVSTPIDELTNQGGVVTSELAAGVSAAVPAAGGRPWRAGARRARPRRRSSARPGRAPVRGGRVARGRPKWVRGRWSRSQSPCGAASVLDREARSSPAGLWARRAWCRCIGYPWVGVVPVSPRAPREAARQKEWPASQRRPHASSGSSRRSSAHVRVSAPARCPRRPRRRIPRATNWACPPSRGGGATTKVHDLGGHGDAVVTADRVEAEARPAATPTRVSTLPSLT